MLALARLAKEFGKAAPMINEICNSNVLFDGKFRERDISAYRLIAGQ
jgi:hypothetical protein